VKTRLRIPHNPGFLMLAIVSGLGTC